MRIRVRGALAGVSLAFAASTAGAGVIVVDTDLDLVGNCSTDPATLPASEGTCSLRGAIAVANATSGSDVILFAPAVFNTATNRVITLESPLPAFAETVEVNADSPPLLTQRVQGIVLRAGTGVTELFAVAAGQPKLDDLTLEGAGVRIDSGRLVFLQTVDSSFAGAIAGAGSLQKEGPARLTLTGMNSYGDTFLEEGTLQGDTGSIPGGVAAAPRTVNDDGILVFDQEMADAPDFFGAINGSGSLQKIGAGTLILRTPNSYSGGTTISAGTLQGFAGSGTTPGALQGNIVNGATLVFDQLANGSFAGSISGSGRVEKIGSSSGTPTELLLTGSNRYGGGTTIREGILRGDADAIPGSVVIASGAQLIFDEAGSGTNGGSLTGGGGLASGLFSVEKRGAGTLTLSGVNSYDGGTHVTGGNLRGTTQSLQGDILLDAGTTLVFDQGFNGAYMGQLTGGGAPQGALQKAGAGTLVLTRDLSLFSGPTLISGGRLEIGRPGDGTAAHLPGAVNVTAGALGGIGSVGGLATAHSGAAISPGNSIGTLTVGSAIFESGSFFEVEISPPVGTPPVSPVDLLVATGTATIAPGARVRVIPGAGDYPDPGSGTSVPILTASAIAGEFDPIPDGTFAFLKAELSQTSTEVRLTVESNGKELDDFAQTGNQRAVGTALEVARDSGDPDVGTVFGELNTMFAADIPDALDAMAGEQLTQFATARLAVGQRFHASLQERIRGMGGGKSDPLLSGSGAGAPVLAASPLLLGELAGMGLGSAAAVALAGATFAMQQPAVVDDPEPAPRGLGAWIDGYGLFGDVSGGSGTDDFDSTIWGVSAGLDARLAERWVVGAAGGWAHSRLDFDDLSGSPEVQTAQGAAYAGYVSPLLEAGAAFRFGWNRMSLDRDIAFAAPSTLSRSADSEFDGIDLGGHAEAALNLFEVRGVVIQPLASLSYAHLQQDAFDESGAGSLSLSAEQEEIDSLVSGVGGRLHTLVELGDGFWLRPELRGRWLHEFGDRERKLEARIGGVPGASYSVRGTELPRDTGTVGLGWTVSRGRLHVFAEYDLAVNPDLLQHSAAIGFKVLW